MIKRLKQFLFSLITLSWLWMPSSTYPFGESNSIWSAMADHFSISTDSGQDSIHRQIYMFLHNPDMVAQWTENARPYLYYILQEVQKRHMPTELALLPMLESDYKPHTHSSAGAVGLWQITRDTASGYGVTMNEWYDGRKSTITSTRVALSFLSYLHQLFNNNWLLALAAYDAGPGRVMSAIHYNQRHNLPTDFWALHLPRETQIYVPRLLALADIIQRPHYYHMKLTHIPNEPITDSVTINQQTNLTTIADAANISVDTVKKLNPAFRQSTTPPHQTVTVVLPANQVHTFTKKIADAKQGATKRQSKDKDNNKVTTASQTRYKVKSGDSLSTIAHHFHTSIAKLKRLNGLKTATLQIGQHLKIHAVIPGKA